jgi:hypothetical protein
MAKYWCRFFDRDEQLMRAERLIALDDERAIANARGAAPSGTVRFQVWRNVHFVHEENVTARRLAERGRCGTASTDWMIGAAALSGIARLSSRR